MNEHGESPEEPLAEADAEMTDDQLDEVAGGFGPMAANEGGSFASPFGNSW